MFGADTDVLVSNIHANSSQRKGEMEYAPANVEAMYKAVGGLLDGPICVFCAMRYICVASDTSGYGMRKHAMYLETLLHARKWWSIVSMCGIDVCRKKEA